MCISLYLPLVNGVASHGAELVLLGQLNDLHDMARAKIHNITQLQHVLTPYCTLRCISSQRYRQRCVTANKWKESETKHIHACTDQRFLEKKFFWEKGNIILIITPAQYTATQSLSMIAVLHWGDEDTRFCVDISSVYIDRSKGMLILTSLYR